MSREEREERSSKEKEESVTLTFLKCSCSSSSSNAKVLGFNSQGMQLESFWINCINLKGVGKYV